MIAQGFQREVGDLIRFHAKMTAIHQNERGVTVHYATGAERREAARRLVRMYHSIVDPETARSDGDAPMAAANESLLCTARCQGALLPMWAAAAGESALQLFVAQTDTPRRHQVPPWHRRRPAFDASLPAIGIAE